MNPYTKIPPTRAGWYWVRYIRKDDTFFDVVECVRMVNEIFETYPEFADNHILRLPNSLKGSYPTERPAMGWKPLKTIQFGFKECLFSQEPIESPPV